jgi:F-type H+-transporting ATPase subunit a
MSKGGYLKKFFNFSSPIMFFVGILELISELSRILSFSFRLFGNVLAGEVLISIVAFLLPSVVSFFLVPFYVLELMAGAIQALVFTMISAVLINMATTKAHH